MHATNVKGKPMEPKISRATRTTAQELARQKADAERERAARLTAGQKAVTQQRGEIDVKPQGNGGAVAHDCLLTDDEFAVVLGHIARHRGFRSNSKRKATSNAAEETSKMKKAMEETRDGLAKY